MKSTFNYKREAGQNPRSGIMSFQHFRGEKLYSDIVVKPENNMTETERVEVYPISPDAEENGRAEGWYPDSSVAYFRILWRDFEPERGKYNFAFIKDILEGAKAHGQELILRLMAHSTRASDDVPEWLKELIPCPERPDGKRVKDSPTDPLFLDLFIEAVKALGAKFDSDKALYAVDISLPGAWGEGHKLELYPDDTLMRITEEYMKAFPTTLLFAQCIRPNIINHVSKTRMIGWRGDGLGNPDHMLEKYPPRIAPIRDKWMEGPVAFESYWWLMEWKRQGWDLDVIMDTTLAWHISSLNPKSMPIPPEWQSKIEDWIAKMGYHFTLHTVSAEVKNGELHTEVLLENLGVAPMYQSLPFTVRLRSDNSKTDFISSADTASWLPGKYTVKDAFPLPKDLESGEYFVDIGIVNEGAPRVYLATDAPEADELYTVGKIVI